MAVAVKQRQQSDQPVPADRKFALLIWGLMVAGVAFVYSASYPRSGRPTGEGVAGNPAELLFGRLEHTVVALAVMIWIAAARPDRIRRAAPWALLISIALMCMTFIPQVGVQRNSSCRWLDLPLLPEFQPSELAKVAFIAFIAAALARKDEGDEKPFKAWRTVIWGTLIMVALLMAQRDQGMATIFVIISLAMAWLAGANRRWLAGISATLFTVGLAWAYHEPYRWQRITAFLNPEGDMDNTSYQIIRMLISVARGGVRGQGLGLSPDKWNSLSWPFTDSIFSVIGGELGLFGGLVLLAAIWYLVRRGIDIARRSQSTYGWYLASGAAVALGIQAILHIAVNTSLVPCTGLTLPFISYGGSSLVSAAMLAGMILSVSRFTRPEARRE